MIVEGLSYYKIGGVVMSKNIEKKPKFWYDNHRLIIGGIAVDPITQKFLGEFCKSFEQLCQFFNFFYKSDYCRYFLFVY